MAGPWEKYQAEAPADGPWAKYSAASEAAAPASDERSSQPQQSTSLLNKIAAIPGAIKESITGTQRRTETTDKLPDWAGMPELNSFSMQSFKAGLGTLMSGPEETAKIIQAQFPGVKVSQDEKGNYLLQSSIDGKTYAIKPGFHASDIPRAGGAIAAFTPAGRAATLPGLVAGSAATQAAIEASQAATGGDFNSGDIVAAGALAPTVPIVAGAARMAAKPVQALLSRVRGTPNPTSAADAPAAVRAAATETPARPTAAELVEPTQGAPVAPAEAPAATPATSTTQRAVWRSQDTDFPVEVLSDTRTAPNGRVYQRILHDGKESYVPQDEIVLPQQKAAPAAETARAVNAPSIEAPPSVELMAAEDLAATARKAATGGFGSNKAASALVEQVAPDMETVAAAERLGVLDHLQPDHYTTNHAYRQLAQLVKSQTGSPAAAAQREGLMQVAERADKLVQEMSGSSDLSTLSTSVSQKLQEVHADLKAKADRLYDEVRSKVPAKSEAPATNVLAVINARADELGGVKNLSPMEKMVLGKLSPKTVTTAEKISGNPLMPGAQTPSVRQIPITRQPTYALLDDVRRDLTAAKYAKQGPFKDADSRLITILEQALVKDQTAAAERYGMSDIWDTAQKTAATYKGIQSDLKAIYGKNLEKSMAPMLTSALKQLSTGDTAAFTKLLRATPPDMRKEVVASGLAAFFKKTTRSGEMDFAGYARWFEGLQRNKQAYTALMSNLPPGAPQQLTDLARVAQGVAMSKGEFIATGKALNPKALEAAESLMGKVFEEVRRRGMAGAIAETVGTAHGLPGLATALASATMANKTPAIKAVDALITSPDFIRAVKAVGKPQERAAALQLVYSKPFTKFYLAIGKPREMSNREQWVMQAMQAQRQFKRDANRDEKKARDSQ